MSNINISGRLHSVATGNIVAGANEILDDVKNKTQQEVNAETDEELVSANILIEELRTDLGTPDGAGSAHSRISALQTELNAKQYSAEAIETDEVATQNSTKLLRSGKIFNELRAIGYFTCSTAAATAAKTVAAAGYVLKTGGNIRILMENANSVDNATLNINSTGAKALYYDGARASATNSWEEGETILVYYDGTSYIACNSKGGGGKFKTGEEVKNISIKNTISRYDTDVVTGGTIYNDIHAPEETTIFENTDETTWNMGNVNSNYGTIVTTYANKYIIINLSSDYDYIEVSKGSSSFGLVIYYYNSSTGKYVSSGSIVANNSGVRKITVKTTKILLLLWDKPSDAQAQAETLVVKAITENPYIRQDYFNTFVEEDFTPVLNGLSKLKLDTENGGITWIQGGLNGNTGFWESNSAAICTDFIKTYNSPVVVHKGLLSGNGNNNYSVACLKYDKTGRLMSGGWVSGAGDSTITDAAYIRIVHYGGASYPVTPSRGVNTGDYITVYLDIVDKLTTVDKIYANPVLRVDFPDPTVWNGEDGYYYALATGGISTRTMWRSVDLVNWENTNDLPYTAATAEAISAAMGNTSYWAPCVVKIKPNQWNLYLTAPSGSSTHRGVAVLTSNHPTIGYTLVRYFAATFNDYIDPHVVRDEQNRVWMFLGSNYQMFRRLLTDDGTDFAENSEWVHVAGRPGAESGNTNRIKTFEGEYLYRRKGYWYLFCSSGQYNNANYAIRVVRSATLDGNFVDKEGNLATDGYAETIMSTSSGEPLYGPGHNSEIFVDREGKTWMLYHSHWTGASSTSARPMCLDEVLWDEDGWPYFERNKPSIKHPIPNLSR